MAGAAGGAAFRGREALGGCGGGYLFALFSAQQEARGSTPGIIWLVDHGPVRTAVFREADRALGRADPFYSVAADRRRVLSAQRGGLGGGVRAAASVVGHDDAARGVDHSGGDFAADR